PGGLPAFGSSSAGQPAEPKRTTRSQLPDWLAAFATPGAFGQAPGPASPFEPARSQPSGAQLPFSGAGGPGSQEPGAESFDDILRAFQAQPDDDVGMLPTGGPASDISRIGT